MRSIPYGKALTPFAAALLLGACGSSGIGDILGGSPGQPPAAVADEVRGTVRYVETDGECRIELEDARVTQRRNLRDDDYGLGGGDRVMLYCDDSTVVTHDGRSYRPEALERGDEVVAEVEQSGNRLYVERLDVLYDVTPGDDRATDYGYGDLRGTVRQVDRDDRTIEIDRIDAFDRDLERYEGERVTLWYDTDTDVVFEGRRLGADNLEPGDVIEVEITEVRGRLVADSIEVVSDVRASRY